LAVGGRPYWYRLMVPEQLSRDTASSHAPARMP